MSNKDEKKGTCEKRRPSPKTNTLEAQTGFESKWKLGSRKRASHQRQLRNFKGGLGTLFILEKKGSQATFEHIRKHTQSILQS